MACKDELGRLLNGHGPDMPTGTNTTRFIRVSEIPKDRRATYLRIVAAYRPEKEKPHRVRFTVGGNLIDYPGKTSTRAADIIVVKIMINSTLSTPHASFMTIDIKDFYLNTPMKRPEYMRIPVHIVPKEIVERYKLKGLEHNGYYYVEINKGMYGLPQAGKIANDLLVLRLKAAGYTECTLTPGLFRHTTRSIVFCLVVDDFAVKYTNKEDVEHLLATLQQHYKISVSWEGDKYLGMQLKWDYETRTCDISMPDYIPRALTRFQHATPATPEDSPHHYDRPQYGAKVQYSIDADNSPILDLKDKRRVQEVLGTLLYYARASTIQCFLPSGPSRPNKPIRQRRPWMPSLSYSTTVQPIQMPSFDTTPAI